MALLALGASGRCLWLGGISSSRLACCSKLDLCMEIHHSVPCPDKADKPEYWNRVYNVQGQHGRSLFEWYGLGQQLIARWGEGSLVGVTVRVGEGVWGGYQQLRSSVLELLAATPSAPSESRRTSVPWQVR